MVSDGMFFFVLAMKLNNNNYLLVYRHLNIFYMFYKIIGGHMDFSESIKSLADRALKVRTNLTTEEATKTALILPFLQVLGYDVFNPLEVVPEYIADVAGRKGEKIDYAIMHENKPIIIIECKCCGAILDAEKCEQLHRYFTTLDSSIAVLTDGVRYKFYSNGEGNKMNTQPFMEFNLENIDPTIIPELRKLCKGKFDLQTTLDTVSELRFNRHIKRLLIEQLEKPHEGFVDYFIRDAYDGRATQKIREQFSGYVERAFREFIAEQIDERLKSALAATPKKEEVAPLAPVDPEEKIVTTEEEWQAYYLVKAILMGLIAPERVILKDSVTRCNILLDDKKSKPLVRLFFNNPKKLRIELIGENKEHIAQDITNVDDILKYADAIRNTAKMYEASKA